jgi:hypothetical protein
VLEFLWSFTVRLHQEKPHMTRITTTMLIAVLCLLTFASDANSAGWRFRRVARKSKCEAEQKQPVGQHPRIVNPYHYHSLRHYYKVRYPKYLSGFHSRETYNLGVPSGDIGLRGTPW